MREAQASPAEYHEPGRYEIHLKGHLDARWADRFEDMRFTHERDGTTILAGPIADQAALYGVLRKARDLGLPLLAVRYIGPEQADATEV